MVNVVCVLLCCVVVDVVLLCCCVVVNDVCVCVCVCVSKRQTKCSCATKIMYCRQFREQSGFGQFHVPDGINYIVLIL